MTMITIEVIIIIMILIIFMIIRKQTNKSRLMKFIVLNAVDLLSDDHEYYHYHNDYYDFNGDHSHVYYSRILPLKPKDAFIYQLNLNFKIFIFFHFSTHRSDWYCKTIKICERHHVPFDSYSSQIRSKRRKTNSVKNVNKDFRLNEKRNSMRFVQVLDFLTK